MKYIYLIIVSILSFLFLSGCQQDDTLSNASSHPNTYDRSTLSVIPLPQYAEFSKNKLLINTTPKWDTPNASDAYINQAVNSFKKHLVQTIDGQNNEGKWTIKIKTTEAAPDYPHTNTSEKYDIKINTDEVNITADNGIGVERALQTLKQLIQLEDGKYHLPTGIIKDAPRYPCRGLMIDVVRHWIPTEVILQNIDAMAMAKMNVLHLHLTDDQGFRIESKSHPDLHRAASNNLYYTQEDIKTIVNYAAERGIRVVPEFDLPGHSTSWLVAYPDLGSKKMDYTLKKEYGVFTNTIDPTNQEVYTFLESFLSEMATLFPDEYIHIGGHEVLPDQWKQNPQIQQFIKDRGLKNEYELQVYFNLRLSEILRKAGKKMIGWDEIIHPELAKENITIQSWRGQESLYDAVRSGNQAILSSGWFLDLKLHASELYAIDPLADADQINIEPDSSQWQAYQITTSINGIDQNGLLILFGANDNIRGILNIMNRNSVFTEAKMQDDRLSFKIDHSIGEINAQIILNNETASGVLQMAVGDIPVKGQKVGGSDMDDGMVMPTFVKQKPLTSAQTALILGGEAGIWTEWVTPQNINSRIWPMAAAVAEKLWSPENLSNDTDDFYRRLSSYNAQLSKAGVISDQLVDNYISTKVGQENIGAMKTFFKVLEEVKQYDRWKYDSNHNMSTPLRQVADVAPIESMEAYRFDQMVTAFIKSPDGTSKINLRQALIQWMPLYTTLKEELRNDPALSTVQFQCLVLSDFAKIADRLLEGQSLSKQEVEYYAQLKEQIMIPRGAVELATAPTLIRLIDHLISSK